MRTVARILALLALLLLIAVGAGGSALFVSLTEPISVNPEVTITIGLGSNTRQVAQLLENEGVIRSAPLLRLLARYREMDTKLHYGEHTFGGSLTLDDVLRELSTAPTPTVRVTIPEGLMWREIGALLERQGVASAAAYEAAVCNPSFLRKAGAAPEANCAEGFLYPDTYDLAPNMTAAEIADLQLARFREVAAPVIARFEPYVESDRTTAQLLNRVLVMASIVEKETNVGKERPLVAAVIRNRVRRGMMLQMDPTVIYGLRVDGGPWDGNLTRVHLRQPTPYNTYTNVALPPGPIANPGRAAIEAVVSPADVDFLFFVATGDGGHQFSKTLREHQNAVRRYQLGRS